MSICWKLDIFLMFKNLVLIFLTTVSSGVSHCFYWIWYSLFLFYLFIYIWWILFAFSSLQLKLFIQLSAVDLCSLIRWSEAFSIRSPGYKWLTSNIVHLRGHNFFVLFITNFLTRLSPSWEDTISYHCWLVCSMFLWPLVSLGLLLVLVFNTCRFLSLLWPCPSVSSSSYFSVRRKVTLDLYS